jgi:hypothetical protein
VAGGGRCPDTSREEAVYNCRVAEYHTYFVGDASWGFSLWAHNSYASARLPRNAPEFGGFTQGITPDEMLGN